MSLFGGGTLPPGITPLTPDQLRNVQLPQWMNDEWQVQSGTAGGVVRPGTVPAGIASSPLRPGDISTPDYRSFAEAGQLQGQPDLRNRLSGTGLQALTERATGTGPSPWLQMATEQQQLGEQRLLGQAQQGSAQQAAQAQANLAMRGGLRGGANERLQMAAGRDLAMAGQDVRQQGALQRAGLGVQDEAYRMQALQQLPGAELSAANYRSGLDMANRDTRMATDLHNATMRAQDLQRQGEHDRFVYGQQMTGTGADAVSRAIAAGGKK